jgi:catechol 2,3-dioxygenase-like lactoylglutathione lyase family enzyme
MSATETPNASREANLGKVDMRPEIDIIPVRDVDRSKQFYEGLGWRLDDDVAPLDGLRIVQFTPPGSGCSITFGKGSPGPRLARPRGGWSSRTSKRLMMNSSGVASRQRTSGTGRRSRSRHGSPGPTRTAPATRRFAPSTIPMETHGSPRRSRHGSPAGSTRRARHSRPRRTWRAHFGVPRPPMPSTRSAPGRTMTGLPGTPHTSRRSRPGPTCRRDRFAFGEASRVPRPRRRAETERAFTERPLNRPPAREPEPRLPRRAAAPAQGTPGCTGRQARLDQAIRQRRPQQLHLHTRDCRTHTHAGNL